MVNRGTASAAICPFAYSGQHPAQLPRCLGNDAARPAQASFPVSAPPSRARGGLGKLGESAGANPGLPDRAPGVGSGLVPDPAIHLHHPVFGSADSALVFEIFFLPVFFFL
jgi:hypothetical protein